MWQHLGTGGRRTARPVGDTGIDGSGMTDGYFSDMSVVDWIGVALMAPFLLAMTLLIVYLTIGLLGSRKRLRQIAEAKAATPPAEENVRPSRTPSEVPGD